MKELNAGRLVRMLRGFCGWHGTNKPFTFVLEIVRSIPFNPKFGVGRSVEFSFSSKLFYLYYLVIAWAQHAAN